MKSKLGISVGLLGAIAYFTALFGGYIPLLLVVGYILFSEENVWLKKTAVKAIVLLLCFSILSAVIGIIPDIIRLINDLFNIFRETFSIPVITRIFSFIQSAVSFVRIILFLLLGMTALNQGTIKVPVVDNIIDKHFK